MGLARGHLLGQDLGQILLVVPALGAGLLGQRGGKAAILGALSARDRNATSLWAPSTPPRRRTRHQAVVAAQIDRLQRHVAGGQASAGRSGQAQRPGMTRVQHHISGGVAALVPGDLGALQVNHHLSERQPDLDPAAGQSRRDQVVDAADPHEPVALDPHLGASVDVGQRIGQRSKEPALGGQRVGDPCTHPAMVATPGHLLGPGVGLGLQVCQVLEAPQRQERGLQIPVGPLDLALGLRLARLQHHQAHAQLPAQGGHLGMQHGPLADPVGHDRGVIVDHHGLGDTAQALQASQDPCRKSAMVLDRLSTTAWAAECGKVVTQP